MRSFEKGDEIQLSDEHAEPLLAVGAIADPSAKGAPKPARERKVVEKKK